MTQCLTMEKNEETHSEESSASFVSGQTDTNESESDTKENNNVAQIPYRFPFLNTRQLFKGYGQTSNKRSDNVQSSETTSDQDELTSESRDTQELHENDDSEHINNQDELTWLLNKARTRNKNTKDKSTSDSENRFIKIKKYYGQETKTHQIYEELLLLLRAYRQHPTRWEDILDEIRGNLEQLPQQTREMYRTTPAKRLRDRLSSKLGKLLAAGQHIEDVDVRNEVDIIIRNERRLLQPQAPQAPVLPPAPQAPQAPVAPPAELAPLAPVAPPVRPAPLAPVAPPAPQAPAALAVQPAPVPPLAPIAQHAPRVPPAPVVPAVPIQPPPRAAPHANVAPLAAQAPPPAPVAPPADLARPPAPAPDRRDAMAAALSGSDDQAQAANPRPARQRRRRLAEVVGSNHELYHDFMTRKMPRILRELGIPSSDSN